MNSATTTPQHASSGAVQKDDSADGGPATPGSWEAFEVLCAQFPRAADAAGADRDRDEEGDRTGTSPRAGEIRDRLHGARPTSEVRADTAAPAPRTGPGLFISFEGIDGAGKSSHIQALADAFVAAGQSVLVTREPGGTPLAEQLRTMILTQAMDPLTETLLCFAARRDHIQAVIAPALAADQVVICDRFTDSTFAYQGGGRGFAQATLRALEAMVQDSGMIAAAGRAPREGPRGALLEPDITFLFILDPAIAAERLAGARLPDKFERQPTAFFQAVSDGYLSRQLGDPGRFALIDASLPREKVWEDVLSVLSVRQLLDAEDGTAAAPTPQGGSR